MCSGFVKEGVCLFSNYIGRVFPFIAYWWLVVSCHSRIIVFVGVRIKQEVGAVKALDERGIPVVNSVCIPHFARVVCVVSCLLHPNREIVVIDSLEDNLGVAA